MLTLRNVTKFVDNNKVVLNSIGLSLSPGHVLALFGSTGSGKTVLMKIIAGDEQATSGAIHLDQSKSFNYCAQQSFFWKNVTLMEQLKLFAILYGVEPEKALQYCLRLDLFLNF